MENKYKLKRIEMYDYPECDYQTVKNENFRSFNQFLKEGCTVEQCVFGHYYHGYDCYMDENGMDKFVAMIFGMLFMIEHDDVESILAWGTNCDIRDFETGEYDDLFTKEDLDLIRNDIAIIKEYISKHPQLSEEQYLLFDGGIRKTLVKRPIE